MTPRPVAAVHSGAWMYTHCPAQAGAIAYAFYQGRFPSEWSSSFFCRPFWSEWMIVTTF